MAPNTLSPRKPLHAETLYHAWCEELVHFQGAHASAQTTFLAAVHAMHASFLLDDREAHVAQAVAQGRIIMVADLNLTTHRRLPLGLVKCFAP